ncbi:MAG: hypothetical protein ACPGJV_07805 [Bacteriovoracaceae bacterium]
MKKAIVLLSLVFSFNVFAEMTTAADIISGNETHGVDKCEKLYEELSTEYLAKADVVAADKANNKSNTTDDSHRSQAVGGNNI